MRLGAFGDTVVIDGGWVAVLIKGGTNALDRVTGSYKGMERGWVQLMVSVPDNSRHFHVVATCVTDTENLSAARWLLASLETMCPEWHHDKVCLMGDYAFRSLYCLRPERYSSLICEVSVVEVDDVFWGFYCSSPL